MYIHIIASGQTRATFAKRKQQQWSDNVSRRDRVRIQLQPFHSFRFVCCHFSLTKTSLFFAVPYLIGSPSTALIRLNCVAQKSKTNTRKKIELQCSG